MAPYGGPFSKTPGCYLAISLLSRPPSKSLSTRDSSSSPPESTDNFLREPTNGTSTRRSVRSIDSGLGDLDPGHSGRDSLVSEVSQQTLLFVGPQQQSTVQCIHSLYIQVQYSQLYTHYGISNCTPNPNVTCSEPIEESRCMHALRRGLHYIWGPWVYLYMELLT